MTIAVTQLDYTIVIDELLEGDEYAVISSESDNNDVTTAESELDVGVYLNWRSFRLGNSILDPSKAEGEISLITSNLYNTILQSQYDDEEEYRVVDKVYNFLSTLEGRKVTVSVKYELLETTEVVDVAYSDAGNFNYLTGSNTSPLVTPTKETKRTNYATSSDEKTIYVGYITQSPQTASSKGGAAFTIKCSPLIAQLDILSPNTSWSDSTETYGGATPSTVANSWTKKQFEMLIRDNTLLSDTPLKYVTSPDYKGLPDKDIWAFIIPSINRLPTINQVLCPYSLVFYQQADGTLLITPLFYDDDADPAFFIDVEYNDAKNWVDFRAVNSSLTIPNRVDATLVNLPGSGFGLSTEDSMRSIYASAPYIVDNKISDLPGDGLKYTEVYRTSTRLYNSGKFTMPQIRNIQVDNALTDPDSIFANSLIAVTKLTNSSVNSSAENKNNYIPQLYAQIYLAEMNVKAYNAIVVYDYLTVINAEDPLGKIVNIANSTKLDYPDNIVTDTTISCDSTNGSLFVIKTAPLLSITGSWFSKGEQNV